MKRDQQLGFLFRRNLTTSWYKVMGEASSVSSLADPKSREGAEGQGGCSNEERREKQLQGQVIKFKVIRKGKGGVCLSVPACHGGLSFPRTIDAPDPFRPMGDGTYGAASAYA